MSPERSACQVWHARPHLIEQNLAIMAGGVIDTLPGLVGIASRLYSILQLPPRLLLALGILDDKVLEVACQSQTYEVGVLQQQAQLLLWGHVGLHSAAQSPC